MNLEFKIWQNYNFFLKMMVAVRVLHKNNYQGVLR